MGFGYTGERTCDICRNKVESVWSDGGMVYCYGCNEKRIKALLESYRIANMTRPLWPEVWMSIAEKVSERSYDMRLKVGAIIVSEDNTTMLSLGYNGNAKGLPNEPESSMPGESGFLHAELNCAIKCDYNFARKKHMYCTHSTCRMCAKIIVNAGVSRFVYKTMYRDASGIDILRQCGVEVMD